MLRVVLDAEAHVIALALLYCSSIRRHELSSRTIQYSARRYPNRHPRKRFPRSQSCVRSLPLTLKNGTNTSFNKIVVKHIKHKTQTTVKRPPVLPWPDIGHLAKWSVSSFKFGFGPECLQDQDPETFWQSVPNPFFFVLLFLIVMHGCSSDGPQPHFITVEFPRKMAIQVLYTSTVHLSTGNPDHTLLYPHHTRTWTKQHNLETQSPPQLQIRRFLHARGALRTCRHEPR